VKRELDDPADAQLICGPKRTFRNVASKATKGPADPPVAAIKASRLLKTVVMLVHLF
jgi:hypothetical protein